MASIRTTCFSSSPPPASEKGRNESPPPPPPPQPIESTLEPAITPIVTHEGVRDLPKLSWRDWLHKDMIAFFILGVLVPLPVMVTTSAARLMFVGITGVNGVCLALPAAITSFSTPLFIHHVSYTTRVLLNILAGMLGLVVCTLGHNVTGPVVGTILAGFVYAFGTNLYLAAAAFYDQRTVIAFGIGTGLSAVVGPVLYIVFMIAFNNNWRSSLLVALPLPVLQALIWWTMLSRDGRHAAEKTRRLANVRDTAGRPAPPKPPTNTDLERTVTSASATAATAGHGGQGFGPGTGRTRIGMFARVILPHYVLPLLLCMLGAMFTLQGLAPTFLTLNSFKVAPKGDLNWQLNFLTYGTGTFLFATVAIFRAMPQIWLWAGVQWVIQIIGIVQLFSPFLTYFPVWLIFIFVAGGIVGGAQTNTNYKIAEDFRRRREPDDVRAFAMSYGSLGNFSGDVIGGAFAVLCQQMAEKHLARRT